MRSRVWEGVAAALSAVVGVMLGLALIVAYLGKPGAPEQLRRDERHGAETELGGRYMDGASW